MRDQRIYNELQDITQKKKRRKKTQKRVTQSHYIHSKYKKKHKHQRVLIVCLIQYYDMMI
jgi:hypothetical protein